MPGEIQNGGNLRRAWDYVVVVISALFAVSMIAWGMFGFEPLDSGIRTLQHGYPRLFGSILFLWCILRMYQRWLAYKKRSDDNDLGWAILLGVLASMSAVLVALDFAR